MPENTSATRALTWLQQSAPQPSTASEALALAVHALLTTHGFRPAQGGEGSTELPAEWREGWGGRYRHGQSAMIFEIRSMGLGDRMVVNAVAVEDDATVHTLELRVTEQVNMEQEGWEGRLVRLNDLATLVQVQIAHRLVPDSAKEGYEAAATGSNRGESSSGVQREGSIPERDGRFDPLRVDPLRDEGHDPLRIGNPRHPGYPTVPGFGHDDVLAPGLPRGLGMPGGMGGMGGNLMGPRNFGGRVDPRRPPGVPQGARFDPYTPFRPEPDAEQPPGFEDEHGLAGRRGARGGGGFEDGPPPGMYW